MRFVNITCEAKDQSDSPIAGAKYTATLDQLEILGAFIVPNLIHATANDQGVAILALWSNSFGVRGSRYHIIGTFPDSGRAFFNELVYVPEEDSLLHEIIDIVPLPPVDLATKALRETSKVLTALQKSKITVDSAIIDFNDLIDTIKSNSTLISESKDLAVQGAIQSSLNNDNTNIKSAEATLQASNAKNSAEAATVAAATATSAASAIRPLFFTINNVATFAAHHSLNHLPHVWLLDQDGNTVETDVAYSIGIVTLTFAMPFTGSLYLK